MATEPKTIGQVIEMFAGNRFLVKMEDGNELICFISGKMSHNHIRVILGDKVEVIVDKYGGKATNKITRRI